MAERRDILWRFLGDSKDLTQATKSANKSMGGMGKTAKAAAGVIGGAFAAREVVQFAGDAISAASDYEESMNAVEVATGEAAADIMRFGDAAAESMGLSKTEVNEAAVTFSAFAEKIDATDVGGTFKEFTARATDFASVMNLETSEALRVFQSGLAGESEPLRRFGLDLSAASVSAHALATGIVDAGDKITESEKVQARYSLLMEQTGKFAGDFANTADGLANTQKILTARWENAKIALGDELVPAMLAATEAGIGLIDFAGDASKAWQIFTSGILDTGEALSGGFLEGSGEAGRSMRDFNRTQKFAIKLLKDGRRPVQIYAEWLADLAQKGTVSDDVLRRMADTLGLTGSEMNEATAAAANHLNSIELTTAAREELIAGLRNEYDALADNIYIAGQYESSADGVTGAVDDMADAFGTAQIMQALFSGSMFENAAKLRDAAAIMAEIDKLFAGGGGSGQEEEPEPAPPAPTPAPPGPHITMNIGVVGDPESAAQTVADLLHTYEQGTGSLVSGVSV